MVSPIIGATTRFREADSLGRPRWRRPAPVVSATPPLRSVSVLVTITCATALVQGTDLSALVMPALLFALLVCCFAWLALSLRRAEQELAHALHRLNDAQGQGREVRP